MAQNFRDNCFVYGHTPYTDMTVIEDNFACLKSMFSGPTAPANPISGYPWFCTSTRNLRMRNASNSAWVGILVGEATTAILVYRDDTDDGWIISNTSGDRVACIKSGTGTYATGGTIAGSWNIAVNVVSHTHDILDHTHTTSDGAHTHALKYSSPHIVGYSTVEYNNRDNKSNSDGTHNHTITINSSWFSNESPSASGNTWRPAAIVCTRQYLDLS